jgi:hypothetical protein
MYHRPTWFLSSRFTRRRLIDYCRRLQTRATQRGYGTKPLHFDWDFLFEAGNLQTTAISKKAVAKAQTRKKMDRLQQSEIIEKWEETLIGMDIIPTKQKKIEKPKNSIEGQKAQT